MNLVLCIDFTILLASLVCIGCPYRGRINELQLALLVVFLSGFCHLLKSQSQSSSQIEDSYSRKVTFSSPTKHYLGPKIKVFKMKLQVFSESIGYFLNKIIGIKQAKKILQVFSCTRQCVYTAIYANKMHNWTKPVTEIHSEDKKSY